MLEREEFAEQTAKPPANERAQLRGLAQAALKADAVTGDPAWDTFCSYIARAIEVAEKQHADAMTALASPSLVNDEKVATIRITIFRLEERIRSLKWVVTMPAEIKRVGEVAKDKLAKMTEEEPSTEAAL